MDFLIFVSVMTAIYFAPTIVAWRKDQVGAVFIVNLFLGWTLFGWIVALFMALFPNRSITAGDDRRDIPERGRATVARQ